MTDPTAGGRVIETRWAELVVGLLFVLAGAVVVVDSYRIGVSWADDGPKAGYFPHYIGYLLALSGAFVGVQTLIRWRQRAGEVFVSFEALMPVLKVLVPTILYVVGVATIGIYVSSMLYIALFMIWQGKFRWWLAALVAIGVPVALFFLFEVWFLIPLPKGPLEQLLGY